VVIRPRIQIPDHFFTSLTITECGISDNLLAFLSRPIFTKLSEMTDADKIMNPQHFGSDPDDTHIRIRINPKIRIQIPDHYRLLLTTIRSDQVLSTVYWLLLLLFTILRFSWLYFGPICPQRRDLWAIRHDCDLLPVYSESFTTVAVTVFTARCYA